jgi:hypothetical protein
MPKRSHFKVSPAARRAACFIPLRFLCVTLFVAMFVSTVAPTQAATDSSLSFFITGRSLGTGGNLGGLAGADAHCQLLADSVGAGNRIWRAYLSTQSPVVNARDRIGTGPWFNANKVRIAADLASLHDTTNLTGINATNGITHRGATVASGRHDIMTGSRFNGMAPAAGADSTCANWTSNATGLPARTIVGHHNRSGISSNMIPNSWNQAHVTSGCSQTNVEAGGGFGYFYCFAADNPGTPVIPRDLARRVGASATAPYALGSGPRAAEIVYRFELARATRVTVTLHDLKGGRRALLAQGLFGPGPQAVRWDGTDTEGAALPPGIYLIAMRKAEAE